MGIETYEQALAYWYGRINYEQTPMPCDRQALKLDRMRALLAALGQPHSAYACIHVAGTKGKGTTAAYLASIFQAAGYRTGLFTSPHLVHVEERIQIQGQMISQQDLTHLMAKVEKAVEWIERSGEGIPTFFEILTAVGLLYFAEQKADLAILEVGLGGRFDATNIVDPLISVITSISFDHMAQLGNTLAEIAFEKAGIIKPGRPVVTARQTKEAMAVITKVAAELGAPLLQLDTAMAFDFHPGNVWTQQRPQLRCRTKTQAGPVFELGLWGQHQAENAALAWLAIQTVQDQWPVSEAAMIEGFRQIHWPARLEIVSRSPWVIIDCAHNGASMQCLVDWLDTAFPKSAICQRKLMLAISKDKDVDRMFPILTKNFDQAMMTRYSSSLRGADPKDLVTLWHRHGGQHGVWADSPQCAWEKLITTLHPNDLLVITGSVFLAGEMRSLIQQTDYL